MMARSIATTVTAKGHTITGRYHGGAYIDLSMNGSAEAFDCINVWDYATNKPTIPLTLAAVRAEIREWIDAAGDSFAHDMREYALMMGGR